MADIKIKSCDNDLEFNIVKGSHIVYMHRRKRKYYQTHPGLLISNSHLYVRPGEFDDTNLSHYHGDIIIPSHVPHKGDNYTVTYLEEQLMFKANKLKSVTIPGTIKEISKYAFCNCYFMTSVTMGEGIELIEEYAFSGCYSLREVVVPDSVKRLEYGVFFCCKELTKVTLGSGIKTITEQTFDECPKIETVICRSEEPPGWFRDPRFKEVDKFDPEIFNKATLKVPSASIEKYRKAPVWKDFKNIVAI